MWGANCKLPIRCRHPFRAFLPPSEMQASGVRRFHDHTATAKGASIRRGLTVAEMDEDDLGVNVRLTDGSSGRYDLVVGADGVFSSIRRRVLGGGCLRTGIRWTGRYFMTERDPSIDQIHVLL